jgi:hypothetical protein
VIRNLICLFAAAAVSHASPKTSSPRRELTIAPRSQLTAVAPRESAAEFPSRLAGQLDLESDFVAVHSNWYQDMFGLVREASEEHQRLRLTVEWRAQDLLQVHVKSTMQSGISLDLQFQFVGERITQCSAEGRWRYDFGTPEDSDGALGDPSGFARVDLRERGRRLACLFVVRGIVGRGHEDGDPPELVMGGFEVPLPAQPSREPAASAQVPETSAPPRGTAAPTAIHQSGQLDWENGFVAVDSSWYQDTFGLVREDSEQYQRLQLKPDWRRSDLLQVHIESTHESGIALDLQFWFVGERVAQCAVAGRWRYDFGSKPSDFGGKLGDPTGLARVSVRDGRLACLFVVRGIVSRGHKEGDPPSLVMGGFTLPVPSRRPGQLDLETVSIPVSSNWYRDMSGPVSNDENRKLRLQVEWLASDLLQAHIGSTSDSGVDLDLQFQFVGDRVTQCLVTGHWRRDSGKDNKGELGDVAGLARVSLPEGRLSCMFDVRGTVAGTHRSDDLPLVSGGFNVLLPPHNR